MFAWGRGAVGTPASRRRSPLAPPLLARVQTTWSAWRMRDLDAALRSDQRTALRRKDAPHRSGRLSHLTQNHASPSKATETKIEADRMRDRQAWSIPPSVPVLASSNSTARGSKDKKDEADNDEDDSNCPQDGNLEQKSEDEQDNPQHDHDATLLSISWAHPRSKPISSDDTLLLRQPVATENSEGGMIRGFLGAWRGGLGRAHQSAPSALLAERLTVRPWSR
jgi:hypothetical protein